MIDIFAGLCWQQTGRTRQRCRSSRCDARRIALFARLDSGNDVNYLPRRRSL